MIDIFGDGLLLVYMFFEFDDWYMSYGIYNILWQIEQVKSFGLFYVYFGYWICESLKMVYKVNFYLFEGLIDGCWKMFDLECVDLLFVDVVLVCVLLLGGYFGLG